MATHLTGRYSLVELLPFSFNGFLAAKGVNTQEIITAKDKGLITGYFEQYFTCGGFPDIIAGESRYPYISSLFNVMDEKQEIPVDGKTIEVVRLRNGCKANDDRNSCMKSRINSFAHDIPDFTFQVCRLILSDSGPV